MAKIAKNPTAATAAEDAAPAPVRAAKKPVAKKAPVAKKGAAPKKGPTAKNAARAPRMKPWSKEEIWEAFSRFHKANPEPKGELEYINAYTLLVAVALSAQATDVGVNKATRNLFPLADTPQKMLALGEDRVRDLIKTIGLYRTKAKNVILMAEQLIARFGGKVPTTREELETLPGVGRKTANVVLNIAFGHPTIAVDTHLFRVGNRTGMAVGKTPLAVELILDKIIPAEFKRHAHHWLILHGRYVCVARKPHCERCIINDLCRWPEKTTA